MEQGSRRPREGGFLPAWNPALMEPSTTAPSLLEELDRRQDEVLAQLEELEERLTALLTDYTGR